MDERHLPRTISELPEMGHTFRPTSQLRWARSDRTTTKPDRLQQAWQNLDLGDIEWRDVPVEIVPALPRERRG